MLIALCIYLWLLLTFAIVFYAEHCGSPYSTLELVVRAFVTPIVFPFILIAHLVRKS